MKDALVNAEDGDQGHQFAQVTVPTSHALRGQVQLPPSAAAAYWAREFKRTTWPASSPRASALRIVDLFSGCGGLSLGAHLACRQLKRRLQIELAADIWPDALEVYKDNFKGAVSATTTDDLGDMLSQVGSTTLSKRGRELADSLAPIDVVLAGPPCQGHSDLNNSSRRDDPRNFLYAVPVAFGLRTKAKILLIENVPPVVHSTSGVVKSAVDALLAKGYAVAEFLADAQDFGVPQTRKRHILIASRLHSAGVLNELLARLERRSNDVAMWSFVSDLEFESDNPEDLATRRSAISSENRKRIDFLFDTGVVDLPNRLRPPCHRDKPHSYVSMYGRLSADLPAQTITSGFGSMGQGRFVHPTQRRMLTPHEAARVQGFPDYFRFTKAKKLTSLREMIGNAVVPPICAVLLTLLLSKQTNQRQGGSGDDP